MTRSVCRWIVAIAGTAGVAATAIPFIPSNEWWIRIFDFPRLQIAAVLALAMLAAPLVLAVRRLWAAAFLGAMGAALILQLDHIARYTPAVPVEAEAAGSCRADSRIGLLTANVLIDNHDAQPLLALVRDVQPDIVLLVETDHWWDRHLAPLRDRFAHVVAYPSETGYGLHLFSRFELVDPEIRFLIEDYVPSLRTELRLPSGDRIALHAVHPTPPPLQDTERRDAELLIVGREVRRGGVPAIVAGDLNDVGWSRTTRLFQKTSGLLDPRIGRGPYATFNANWPLLRWPLDHVFFEESFWLLDLAVLPDIGSDHFPLYVELCHDPAAAPAQEQPEPERSDAAAASEMIREGRQEAREDGSGGP